MPRPRPNAPCPSRRRRLPRSFGWIDHRLLRDGHLGHLGPVEIALYAFFVLAANADGLSWYRFDRICRELGHLDWGVAHRALQRLIELELVAFAPWSDHDPDGVIQVLPLDGQPSRRPINGR